MDVRFSQYAKVDAILLMDTLRRGSIFFDLPQTYSSKSSSNNSITYLTIYLLPQQNGFL